MSDVLRELTAALLVLPDRFTHLIEMSEGEEKSLANQAAGSIKAAIKSAEKVRALRAEIAIECGIERRIPHIESKRHRRPRVSGRSRNRVPRCVSSTQCG